MMQPGDPFQLAGKHYGIFMKREPRRGARRKKPYVVAQSGLVWVRWVGEWKPLHHVFWIDSKQAFRCRRPGTLIPSIITTMDAPKLVDDKLLCIVAIGDSSTPVVINIESP